MVHVPSDVQFGIKGYDKQVLPIACMAHISHILFGGT